MNMSSPYEFSFYNEFALLSDCPTDGMFTLKLKASDGFTNLVLILKCLS